MQNGNFEVLAIHDQGSDVSHQEDKGMSRLEAAH